MYPKLNGKPRKEGLGGSTLEKTRGVVGDNGLWVGPTPGLRSNLRRRSSSLFPFSNANQNLLVTDKINIIGSTSFFELSHHPLRMLIFLKEKRKKKKKLLKIDIFHDFLW